jgi:hypothetical protein
LIRTRLGSGYATDKYKQEAELDLLGDMNHDGIIGGTPEDQKWASIKGANPSGVPGDQFFGTFDGNDKGIQNLYIDEVGDYQGLFGFAGTSSTISNVKILSGKVTGGNYTGGVAGQDEGTIEQCSNEATVTGTSYVGGVAGNGNNIINCKNSGTVTGISSYERVGGVVGNSSGAITGCSNSGAVTGSDIVGGVVGRGNGNIVIAGCTNSGTVEGTNSVGGVVGAFNSGAAVVIKSFNDGRVTGKTQSVGVGGVIGRGWGHVIGCYNTAAVSGMSEIGGVAGLAITVAASYNTGAVSGNNKVGGVVGLNYTAGNSGTVTACYNTGMVTGSAKVGGVVGDNYHNNTYQGIVTASYWQSDRGVSVGIGYDSVPDTSTSSFSSNTAFPNLSGNSAWGTGDGTGAGVSPLNLTTNDWWQLGTTNGGTLPKLWFE